MKIQKLNEIYERSGIINQFGVSLEEIPEDVKDFASRLIERLHNPRYQIRDLRRFVLFLDIPVLAALYGTTKSFIDIQPSNYKELHTLFEIGFNLTFLTPILFYMYVVLNELNRKERELVYDILELVLDNELSENEIKHIRNLAEKVGEKTKISKRVFENILSQIREA